ncbi:CDP-diacylglycerol--glycerol-3-phosphate 3-phosphatidyltransferase [Actinopolymorpha cephalotaxi]|uniref:Phosphatidylinositol phosphate synthase n=1 Tax=Actinopolymorpha cephalotaxi TaxID=504797 RepID=A0A1I2PZY2_9ACTN|nr:CDP-alcohol phosphatidyltransferase family protein [Actinopolymorpha cephalotaxi]NYH83493.1 CDP-diacylglycerol--glycerol-3-phosphate 3-phosphatidyltransferase [Actinopolymorpha cephalotaxi]SFG18951.1 CDP-diacylglycerol--glycerol-3-phosphate 3-phosphatidyltransferase [Actinopolymorpha cephalotaxi]
MLRRFHQFWLRLLTPVARFFLRVGIGPDIVTVVGTAGLCVGALAFYPRGVLFWGTVFITFFVFSDMIDGLMARMSQRSSKWGAFLDSTLDRIGDAAVFGGLTLWFAGGGDAFWLACVALYCLVMGNVTSYAKARAESLGMTANVGIAERADRLVAVLVATGLAGLGVPFLLPAVLCLLAVASTVTVVQRILAVRAQAAANEGGSGPGRSPGGAATGRAANRAGAERPGAGPSAGPSTGPGAEREAR